jgi:crossover junction endodeoxyribonuclease RusA
MVQIFISGQPAPQGSKRHVGNGIMIESCKRVKPWRESIRCALTTEMGQPVTRLEGAVRCGLEFVLRRPVSTPKRTTPPAVKKPDIDKLGRAVLDAITSAGVIGDDSQVVSLMATKRIAELGETPGLHLSLEEL